MALEVMELIRGVVSVKITGELRKADLQQMRGAILQGLKQWSRIRLHVIVENFTGCEASLDGDDVQAPGKYDRNIEKVAILGEEQWRNGSAQSSARIFSRRLLSTIRPPNVPAQLLGSPKGYDRCATSEICEASIA